MVKKFFPVLVEFSIYENNKIIPIEESLYSYNPNDPILINIFDTFTINDKKIKLNLITPTFKYSSYIYTFSNFVEKYLYTYLYSTDSDLFVINNMIINKKNELIMILRMEDNLEKGTIFIHNSILNSSDKYHKKLMREVFTLIETNFNTNLYIMGFSAKIKLFRTNKLKPIYNVKNYINNLINSR